MPSGNDRLILNDWKYRKTALNKIFNSSNFIFFHKILNWKYFPLKGLHFFDGNLFEVIRKIFQLKPLFIFKMLLFAHKNFLFLLLLRLLVILDMSFWIRKKRNHWKHEPQLDFFSKSMKNFKNELNLFYWWPLGYITLLTLWFNPSKSFLF